MLSLLPPECILAILEYLPIPQLTRLNLVSRTWRNFIDVHHSSIYHAAAILHQFAPESCRLDVAKGIHSSPWLENVHDWLSLCKSHFHLHAAWTGQRELTTTVFAPLGESFHRIKIDEVERTMITTADPGLLRVTAIESGASLWFIRTESSVHCEFDNGFFVFNRRTRFLEVWRRARDHANDPLPATSPDAAQLARILPPVEDPPARGSFVPFTALRHDTPTRAFRFAWPTLLVGLIDGTACVWDIPSATLLKKIDRPSNMPLEPPWITYVEVSARHAFICNNGQLLVFDRHKGDHLLKINENGFRRCYIAPQEPVHPLSSYPILQTTPPGHSTQSSVVACHVSRDARDLVAITASGSLLYIPGFERAIGSSCKVQDIGYRIMALNPIYHLAFDGSRVIFSSSSGVYAFTLSSEHQRFYNPDVDLLDVPLPSSVNDNGSLTNTESVIDPLNKPFPSYKTSIQHLVMWDSEINAANISCIQMTKTGLWVVAPPLIDDMDDGGEWESKIHYIDFSSS